MAGDTTIICTEGVGVGTASISTSGATAEPSMEWSGPSWDYERQRPAPYTMSGAAPSLCCCFVRRLGRMYVFLDNTRRGQRGDGGGVPKLGQQFLCIGGPCWPMVFVTLGLLLGVPIVTMILFFPPEPSASKTFAMVIIGLAMALTTVTYLLTACGDPGIHPRIPEKPPIDYPGYYERCHSPSEFVWNEQTKSYRAPGVMYCHECQVLIEDIDHFCPWTGTTIAAGNMRCFRWFVGSVCLLLVLTVLVAIIGVSSSFGPNGTS